MTNHVTPDGLLDMRGRMYGKTCEPTIRYRDETLILQDSCTPEPRIELNILAVGAFLELDVVRATALYHALDAFLKDSRGQTGWQYGGVVYDLDKAWQGRPGTVCEGTWFRHNDEFAGGVPVMEQVDPVNEAAGRVALTDVLGLQPCPVHKIWSEPCHECHLDEARKRYAFGDTDPMRGE